MFDNTQDISSESKEARASESPSLFGEAMQLLGSQQFKSNEGMQTSGQDSVNNLFGPLDLFDSKDDGSLVLSHVKGKSAPKSEGEREPRASTRVRDIERERDPLLRPDPGEPNNKFEIDKKGDVRRAVLVDEDGLSAREVELPEGGDARDIPEQKPRNPEDRFIDHTEHRDGKPSEVIDVKTLPNGKVRKVTEVDDDGLTAREVEFDIEVGD